MMRAVIATLAVLLALAAPSGSRGADLRYFDDAALHAVHFADAMEGWAAGDEGVIWHTIDGGRTWERQASGTHGALVSIYFFPKNPFVGWIAGREELPYGQGSVGILLFTRDGGITWQRVLANAMPGLNRVRFTDPKTGFVFGDGSDQFPTGVFKTRDGGRTWEPVAGPRSPSWLAGDFLAGDMGILAGAWSRLATFRQERFTAADIEGVGFRHVHGVHIMPQRALAVGQGGLVLTSETRGAAWGFAKLKLAGDVLANLDFHAVHGTGDHAWVAGRPGSVLLHSPDQGKTWKLHKTGQPLPLNGVFFLDQQNGWAVGELGSILASTDGGQTWKVQHQGGKRAALMLVHSRPAEVPVDTLALLGAEEGYLATALRVVAPDPQSAALRHAMDGQRLAAAVRQAGGAAAEMLWQFPMPEHLAGADKKALLQYWIQLHGNHAEKQLLRQLVLALRTWRPNVVITDHPDPKVTDNTAGALVAEALHEAVAQAADSKAFPEQIAELGLEPWRVTKVYALWDKRSESQVIVDGHEARTRLQSSACDYAGTAAGLLADSPRELPRQRFYRLLESPIAEAANQKHLLDGVPLAPGSDARRPLPVDEKPDAKAQKAYKDRRTLEALAVNLADPGKSSSRSLAQIGPLLAGMPDNQAAAAALALGNLYARQGQWDLARETFLLMVDRYPAHPLSVEAYRWLVRHISSSEAMRRHELEQFLLVTNTAFMLKKGAKKAPTGTEPTDAGSEMIQDGQLTLLSNKMETRQWYRGSLEFGARLAGFGPLYASDPAVQFCLQASRRNLGEFDKAREWYQKSKTYFPKGPWHDAAAAELWLESPVGPPPKPVALCRFTDARPFLDGKLDDACWQGLKPIVLRNAVGKTVPPRPGEPGWTKEQEPGDDYATEARFAFDQEYLYIALCCKHPAGKQVPPVKPRQRDADLRAYDRVSIMLDLDRDYSTYFHLQIDQRGCLREDCWGDVSWNPRWFVAVHSTQDCWQIEAALPLSELTGDRVRPGTAWACNVVRILPGRGVQALSLPADIQPRPEGMGLLLFRQEAARPASRLSN